MRFLISLRETQDVLKVHAPPRRFNKTQPKQTRDVEKINVLGVYALFDRFARILVSKMSVFWAKSPIVSVFNEALNNFSDNNANLKKCQKRIKSAHVVLVCV